MFEQVPTVTVVVVTEVVEVLAVTVVLASEMP